MKPIDLFTVLDSIESTNNYAMGQVHAGLAKHGQAWFANDQWGGKGQRAKKWISKAGENIIMSIVVKPDKVFRENIYHFNLLVAGICHRFFGKIAGNQTKIKWPNDIYFADRKAGGILIENIFKGNDWAWSVVGIGLNVNQTSFGSEIENASSLKIITGLHYDTIGLAKQLHSYFLEQIGLSTVCDINAALEYYNMYLYKKDERVQLKYQNTILNPVIKVVNTKGQLIAVDEIERIFNFGEVEWLIPTN